MQCNAYKQCNAMHIRNAMQRNAMHISNAMHCI